MIIELTEDQAHAVAVCIADSIKDFQSYAENEVHDEDAVEDAKFAMELMDLAKLFPNPDEPIQLKE